MGLGPQTLPLRLRLVCVCARARVDQQDLLLQLPALISRAIYKYAYARAEPKHRSLAA